VRLGDWEQRAHGGQIVHVAISLAGVRRAHMIPR